MFISFQDEENEPALLMFGSNGLPYFSLNALLAKLDVLLERNSAILASIVLFLYELHLKTRPQNIFFVDKVYPN